MSLSERLEQRRVEPGYWMIEGYEVHRVRDRPARWQIRHVGERNTRMLAHFPTVEGCREWIAEQPGVNADYRGE